MCFGLPVFLCAAVLFPFHLGWTGASLSALAGYLLIAALLFSLTDVMGHPSYYPRWLAIAPQSVLTVFALAVPAVAAFSLAAFLGPVEERLEDEVCASSGEVEMSDTGSEADDVLDVTADCGPAAGGG